VEAVRPKSKWISTFAETSVTGAAQPPARTRRLGGRPLSTRSTHLRANLGFLFGRPVRINDGYYSVPYQLAREAVEMCATAHASISPTGVDGWSAISANTDAGGSS